MISITGSIIIHRISELEDFHGPKSIRLRRQETFNELYLEIPSRFETNKEKTVYKTGFLIEFLSFLYPEKTKNEIYDIMNKKYHLFITKRQMQRNYSEYKTNKKYH